jgi:hypothetical protein
MKFNKDVALAALAIALFIGAHAAVDALDRRDAEKAAEKESPVYVVEVSKPVDMPHPIVPKEEAVMAASVKTVEIVPVAEPEAVVAESATTYPVPLDEELQLFIIGLCEDHHIDPAVVFCMIHQESSFDASKIGDSGEAYGLLQIWPKWHGDRMKKLGCEDLLDPYQNVTVGIDYYAECLEKYDGDNAKALTAYNQGSYKGVVNKHAKAVLAKLEDLKDVMK